MPFKTKICGVTTRDDANMLAAIGVDAIGLNFFEGSKRYVTPETAARIVEQLPPAVKRVGVFVNASVRFVEETSQIAGLDFVQLHGDESPEFLDALNGLTIVKAFRCQETENALQVVTDFLSSCRTSPAAVLLDAYDSNEFGGTGKSLDWPDLANAADNLGNVPLILAGGLTSLNVAHAIQAARPFGVDTASGVETATPGRKDKTLSADFVKNAEQAFAKLRNR